MYLLCATTPLFLPTTIVHYVTTQAGDLCVVAASDGLWTAVPTERVWHVATTTLLNTPPSQAAAQSVADALIAQALAHHTSDNVTVAVLLPS